MSFWRRRKPCTTVSEDQFMATLADVNTALSKLATAFGSLETQAKAVYAQFQANQGNTVTPADLDAVVATINGDTDAVIAAQAAITAVTPAAG